MHPRRSVRSHHARDPKAPREGAAGPGVEEQRRTAAGLHESQAKIAVVGLADG